MATTAEEGSFQREYTSSSSVQHFSSTPRFGHSKDVASLFDGDAEEQHDYIVGLAWAAGLLAACFLVFIIFIIVFKCCGKRRVGFLSGAHFQENWDDDFENKEQHMNDYDNLHEQSPPLPTKNRKRAGRCSCCGNVASVRFTFMLSGCIFIAFAMLMVVKGVTNLQDTVKTVHHSAANIEYMALQAQDILQNGIRQIQTATVNVRTALEQELERDDLCPNNAESTNNAEGGDWTSKASQAVADLTSKASQAVANWTSKALQAVTGLSQIDTLVDDRVNGIVEALSEAGGQAQAVMDQIGDVDLTDWEALLILILYTLVPTLLVSAAILAHFDIESTCFYMVLDFAVLPLFILMVLVCVFVSCAMLAAAAVNSDFCLPGGRPEDSYPGWSPDTSVLRFLDAQGFAGDNDPVRKIVEWYVFQCQADEVDDPFAFIATRLPDLQNALASLDSVSNNLDGGLMLSQEVDCGRDLDRMEVLLAEMRSLLEALLESVYQMLDLLSCERVVRIYTSLLYDGACQYSVNGVMWVFASSLVMAIFGLVMILFRSAYKPTRYAMVRQVEPLEEQAQEDEDSKASDGHKSDSESYDGRRIT